MFFSEGILNRWRGVDYQTRHAIIMMSSVIYDDDNDYQVVSSIVTRPTQYDTVTR